MQLNPDFSNVQHIAIVPAAGTGQRFGAALPKQYTLLAGLPMLALTVERLLVFSAFDAVCVVVSPGDTFAAQVLAPLACQKLHIFYEGGPTRAQTVSQALAYLSALGAPPSSWVWVHDAARPGFPIEALDRLQTALQADCAAILSLAVADTVKRIESAEHSTHLAPRSAGTQDRSTLRLAQTPQVAQLSVLSSALLAASAQGAAITDEASALELCGVPVTLVQGSARNFKVTTQDDAAMMEALMMQNSPLTQKPTLPRLRIGEGMDVHALVLGRPLVLGGITIQHTHGLQGHSDADALCHALTDALLGAANLGDIGRMFPDTDAQYAGADSTVLLAKAYAAVQAAGWTLVNLDATIIAQAPKLSPHIPAMQSRLAQVLACSESQINIKAKTNENLGFLGRKEGIECRVSVLLTALE